ncbi:MAG: aminotransferase class V-fold PLP-dependent enzyme [Nocardioides sp.]
MPAPTRRTFLGAGFATVAAAGLTACDADASSTPAAAPAAATQATDWDPSDWDDVRAQFPLDPSLAQFAAFVLSPHTKPLDAAIARYRDELAFNTEGALARGPDREDAVRRAAADFAGGAAGQYALTDSTTMGIAHMYGGLSLQPGDEVLSTTHDFFSTEDALRLLELRTGASVKRVTLYDEPWTATVEEIVDRLMKGVTEKTKVVAVTWVHSSTGVRLPIREIADALDGRALLCVDGVHGFAAVDVDLPDLGADVLATGTHKWLFGPRGTGILWAKDFGPLTELIPSFDGFENGARLTPGGYKAFEHRWAMADAFAIQQRITRKAIVERTVAQATQLKEGLRDHGRITVITPQDPAVSAGIVCVDVAGMLPANAVLGLGQQGIVASATPYRTSYLRLGPSIATTPDQVDAAIDAVSGLV